MPDSDLSNRVPVERLRWHLAPDVGEFRSTADLEPTDEIIGQDAAVEAIRTGLELESYGYNIFITGLVGTGRLTVVRRLLKELLDERGDAPAHDGLHDLCYIHNFDEPDLPRLLVLDKGQGASLAAAMDVFIDALESELPQIFESNEYEAERKELVQRFRKQQSELIDAFQAKVQAEGFALVQVQMGPIARPDVTPTVDGKPVGFEQLEALKAEGKMTDEQLEAIRGKHETLVEELGSVAKEMRSVEREVRERVRAFDRDVVRVALDDLLGDIRAKFEHRRIRTFLAEVERDVLKNPDRFRREDPSEEEEDDGDPNRFYRVNVIVDNRNTKRPPIIIETNPSYRNLFGTIEGRAENEPIGRADFSHVRAGSLLRAHGGYLILNAIDLFAEASVWPALKRTLRTGSAEIQGPATIVFSQWGVALKPEPAPFRTKVVLIGDARMYALLYSLDEDFQKIFKVKAEFDASMPLTEDAVTQYGRFIAMICRSETLLPFDRHAVANVVEFGVRRAGHQERLSTHFTFVKDVVVESAYWAKKAGAEIVRGEHVDHAIEARRQRINLIERRLRETIERDEILIDTTGTVVGQVNGLAVYQLGDHIFGMPSRITATVGVGRAGLVNIERESALSGSTHDKGVLILAGFLRERFAQRVPLALSASLCFEQSYGGVDGDSASSTEAYALLSTLSNVPVRQDIAVTGSINQKGEIQPIGGVNEKIEGFYDVCRSRGLTGTQGVLIPKRNVQHLMLREDLVDAVREGRFTVYAIQTIEEGIELLLGMPAGRPDELGAYGEGTVGALVAARLDELSRQVSKFGGVWGGEV